MVREWPGSWSRTCEPGLTPRPPQHERFTDAGCRWSSSFGGVQQRQRSVQERASGLRRRPKSGEGANLVVESSSGLIIRRPWVRSPPPAGPLWPAETFFFGVSDRQLCLKRTESVARGFGVVAVGVSSNWPDLHRCAAAACGDVAEYGRCERLDVEFGTLAGHRETEVSVPMPCRRCPPRLGRGIRVVGWREVWASAPLITEPLLRSAGATAQRPVLKTAELLKESHHGAASRGREVLRGDGPATGKAFS